ncbi:cell wall / vacuolar inhibitor of fructosidase 2-like [Rhodamnia argentea]|uniref:Cell wall / vacuolar inhibitor of fructosidase 2-like n=1 Tax=Rhodamnia argentea TaxID=178133 RepID=A0A8B8QTU9_9MYRT|nr:cell wall / vacuolar inhibitor of fructosidase 2-like [Rhodamnia argentea]
MTSFSSPRLALLCFVFIALSVDPSSAATEMVKRVCDKTSDYRYCVAALYSDPRTPNADAYFLAYISFGLAYLNATHTRDHISGLLRSPGLTDRSPGLTSSLQSCSRHYAAAIAKFESAYNDLNSETFSDLAGYSGGGANAAEDCDRAFGGSAYAPLMAGRNRDLKRLSEICTVVSKLFT